MIVYVPFTGFVPGQSIPVTIELDNNSNVDVDSIKIKLERVIIISLLGLRFICKHIFLL